MSKTTTTIDQAASVSLPPEALDALGVEAGAELDVQIIGRALVVRSVEEAQRSREFINSFESVLTRRRSAYDDYAMSSLLPNVCDITQQLYLDLPPWDGLPNARW
jgi:antitoxin component of MazEF toxin-antitoxin module